MALPMKPGIVGGRILPVNLGSRLTATLLAPMGAVAPIQLNRFFRNDQHPDAVAMNMMHASANASMMNRTREHFSTLGRTQGDLIISAAGSTPRFRFPIHTGPYSSQIAVVAQLKPPSSNQTQNTHGKLTIYSDTQEATTVTSETFIYGPNPTGTALASSYNYWKVVTKIIGGLTPNTTYYAKYSNETYGRVHSICVCDLASATDNADGYLPENITQESLILDVHRERLAEYTVNLWKRGGSKVFTWCADDQTAPRTIAVATPTNVIDGTTTAISATSHGFTIDMRGKDRVSQSSGIPVTLYAFIKNGGGGAGALGRVYLKSSAGTTVLQITNGLSTTSTWLTATGFLPATLDKYDLMFDNNSGGTVSLYAAGVYEHE